MKKFLLIFSFFALTFISSAITNLLENNATVLSNISFGYELHEHKWVYTPLNQSEHIKTCINGCNYRETSLHAYKLSGKCECGAPNPKIIVLSPETGINTPTTTHKHRYTYIPDPTSPDFHIGKCECGKITVQIKHELTYTASTNKKNNDTHIGTCKTCGYKTAMLTHEYYEDQLTGPFRCKFCSIKLVCKEGHHDYKYDIDPNNANNHIGRCSICNIETKPSPHLEQDRIFNSTTNHYECDKCGQTLKCPNNQHQFNTNGICQICNVACKHNWSNYDKFDETMHFRTCIICNKTEYGVHSNTNATNICDICNQAFTHPTSATTNNEGISGYSSAELQRIINTVDGWIQNGYKFEYAYQNSNSNRYETVSFDLSGNDMKIWFNVDYNEIGRGSTDLEQSMLPIVAHLNRPDYYNNLGNLTSIYKALTYSNDCLNPNKAVDAYDRESTEKLIMTYIAMYNVFTNTSEAQILEEKMDGRFQYAGTSDGKNSHYQALVKSKNVMIIGRDDPILGTNDMWWHNVIGYGY
ncbi:MAG: hypothetical protein IJS47_02725 [Clostridia bacterium]|nr:hypothetical protein [Clostridia bacterium]